MQPVTSIEQAVQSLVGKLIASDSEASQQDSLAYYTDDAVLALVADFFQTGKGSDSGVEMSPEEGRLSEKDRFEDCLLWLDYLLSRIDDLIIGQVNAIIHHPVFQRLESSWRNLESLVDCASGRNNVKIRFLDITWAEITKDVNRAMEFDQSQLFHKVYSEEYDTPGGEPYGVLIADYEISHRPGPKHRYDDVPTLKCLSEIAGAAFSPILINASPELFGLDGAFDYLTHAFSLESVFREQEYAEWQTLRNHPDARFMGITLPRVLLRKPYTVRLDDFGGLIYDERRGLSDSSKYLWGGANMAVAKVLIREFSDIGWFSHIRGAPRDQLSGGIVNELVVDYFRVGPDETDFKPGTDVVITDERERELADQGFIAACQCYDLPLLAFHSMPSIFRNREFTSSRVNADERVASSLQYLLCGSRFAHYIKIMMRDKIGSYTRASDCASMLQKWLNGYTVMQEDADWYLQSRYPLRKALVEVFDNPEKPGEYWAEILLQPHYQADSLRSDLHLTTELTGARRG
ncbi:MAG: type VI secretion system contractile sheath large subunit [Gammaproteobacteria bacterium]|nr:MAG: type VI secretion system contractile sheath large subunit [Pseudomonadota bacterium]PIE37971.1 MAG: type VI secretion system contractile sheath large subunit [Gammaproteobacteria bacterium]